MVSAADVPSSSTSAAMRTQILILVRSLSRFSQSSQQLQLNVPADVVSYVELGRNPDIYTREFVEGTQRLNQERKGRSEAYAAFRDALAKEIKSELPELQTGVDDVLRRTGG